MVYEIGAFGNGAASDESDSVDIIASLLRLAVAIKNVVSNCVIRI